MPTFTLFTNLSRDKIPKDFLKDTTNILAKTLEKPKKYCIIHIVPDQMMIMGGSNDPCASATITCIGKLDMSENKKHSAVLFAHVEKELGIPSNRMYITYNDMDKANVGYEGTTFAEILGK